MLSRKRRGRGVVQSFVGELGDEEEEKEFEGRPSNPFFVRSRTTYATLAMAGIFFLILSRRYVFRGVGITP